MQRLIEQAKKVHFNAIARTRWMYFGQFTYDYYVLMMMIPTHKVQHIVKTKTQGFKILALMHPTF